jgi:hypothetical protein
MFPQFGVVHFCQELFTKQLGCKNLEIAFEKPDVIASSAVIGGQFHETHRRVFISVVWFNQ